MLRKSSQCALGGAVISPASRRLGPPSTRVRPRHVALNRVDPRDRPLFSPLPGFAYIYTLPSPLSNTCSMVDKLARTTQHGHLLFEPTIVFRIHR